MKAELVTLTMNINKTRAGNFKHHTIMKPELGTLTIHINESRAGDFNNSQ